jgi:hypothetical protein
MAEPEKGAFADYDDAEVYKNSEEQALNALTRNFVVEFGLNKARIAFDLDEGPFKSLLDTPQPFERPIRWV